MSTDSQTKTCSKCGQCLLVSMFSKQKKGKYGVTSACRSCSKKRIEEWRQKNIDRFKEVQKAYAAANKEKSAACRKEWTEKNRDQIRSKAKEWTKNNRHIKIASTAKRRAALLNAIPPWADLNAIKLFYKWARDATRDTGIKWQVDHIYPLQSPVVCGLHVWENLQILTEESNKRKGNRCPA